MFDRWLKGIVGIVGLLALLLGGLWFLQGTGLVVIEPIACVGECDALEGPSVAWAITGFVTMLGAGGALWWVFRRR